MPIASPARYKFEEITARYFGAPGGGADAMITSPNISDSCANSHTVGSAGALAHLVNAIVERLQSRRIRGILAANKRTPTTSEVGCVRRKRVVNLRPN